MAWPILLFLAEAVAAPVDFDLAKLPRLQGVCRPRDTDQIIVCAPKEKATNRVQDLGNADEPYLPKAELKLFGDVKAAVENEAANVGGFPSNRVMMRLKIPF